MSSMSVALSFSTLTGVFHMGETAQIEREEEERQHSSRGQESQFATLDTSLNAIVTLNTEEDKSVPKEKSESLRSYCFTTGQRGWTYRNLFAASISFMFINAAFLGIKGLQSSLNEEVGVTSLSVGYAFYFLIGFVTTAIIRLLGTKYALLFGYICYTVYTISNFYPEFVTLVPSSILLGIGSGPLWASVSTHVGTVAVIYSMSPNTSESLDAIISKFIGIFFFTFQLSEIVGNTVSSLVLFPYSSFANGTSTLSQSGDVCNNTEAQNVTNTQRYILLSTYLGFDILAIIILLIFLSKISTGQGNKSMKNRYRRYCSEPFIDLLRVLFSWKMLLLGPLSFYNGIQLSFTFSSYTRNVVSMCVGVSKVGFTLIVFGLFSAITSVLFGKLVKWIHRIHFGNAALIVNLFFLFFLQFYPLRPSYELVFLFAIFWGCANGIWNTLVTSLLSILFPDHQDSAFSALRIWMSLGFAIGFAVTDLNSFSAQIWIVTAILFVSYTCYILLEVFVSRYGQKVCCNRDLGFFDGPKSKHKNKEYLTETMLDMHFGDRPMSEEITDHVYIPPVHLSHTTLSKSRSATFAVTSDVGTLTKTTSQSEGDLADSRSVGADVAASSSSGIYINATQKNVPIQTSVF